MCICVYIIYITNRLVLSGLKSLSKKASNYWSAFICFPSTEKNVETCQNGDKEEVTSLFGIVQVCLFLFG